MGRFNVILGMDWLSRYRAVIDCARHQASLYTKNDQIVYQASQHAIKSSHILQSILGGKGRLETYSSSFAIEGDVGTRIDYSGLMVVDEFPNVFLDELLGLPPDREIKFSIDLVPESQPIYITP